MKQKKNYKNLIIDVDGVMTDGKFYYSERGKIMKLFGADDNDALKILSDYMNIHFITGDKKGLKISKKRIVTDMGFKLNLVSTIKRIEWIEKNYDLNESIYIGDGFFDSMVMSKVAFSFAPFNASELAKKEADILLKRSGGDRAVAEAVIYILKNFLNFKNISSAIKKNKKFSGNWTN
tara:strand:+ start:6963 stop:7496 length:534 start_codon:yes stop_codon:yes gene_type:complete